jgi:hypothetical protein
MQQQQQPHALVLEAVRQDGTALKCEYTAVHLKGDRQEAVRQDGYTLRYVADYLKGDRELVFEAVRQDGRGRTLQFSSDHLRGDREIVLKAVRQTGWGLGQGVSSCIRSSERRPRAGVRSRSDTWLGLGLGVATCGNRLCMILRTCTEHVPYTCTVFRASGSEMKCPRTWIIWKHMRRHM